MILSSFVFDDLSEDYDSWFEEHLNVYRGELRMLRPVVPMSGRGLEVGVGSGRFAEPLGIRFGIDPARKLLMMAKRRGIEVIRGEGEHLPYRPGSFDYVLMITVVCFVRDPLPLFYEAFRVLSHAGMLIVCFIERDGEIAQHYLQEKIKGRFLRFAKFRTIREVSGFFGNTGFYDISIMQHSHGFCVMRGVK